MKTPRENVIAALNFASPDRVPRDLWTLPWAEERFPEELAALREQYPMDFVTPPTPYRPARLAQGNPYQPGTATDEWGCHFINIHAGLYGEVKEPILLDIADRHGVHAPYETLPEDMAAARDRVNRFCTATEAFVRAPTATRLWERHQFLRGTEAAMLDLLEAPDETTQLLGIIHDFNLRELAFWCSTDIDAFVIYDDWGSQNALLIPPTIWRSFFKPLYREYCDLAHARGKYAFMHSDGNITEIYPDLVEIGIDALNSQVACMDLDELARLAKGKLTFWGEVDRQHILCAEDPEVARQEVRRLAEKLHDPAGGIIAQVEFGAGARPETVAAVYDEWACLPVQAC